MPVGVAQTPLLGLAVAIGGKLQPGSECRLWHLADMDAASENVRFRG